MRTATLIVGLLGAGLVLGACPGPASPLQAEVLDYDSASGEWRLATSPLDTVLNLNDLSGKNFDLVGDQLINSNMIPYQGSSTPASMKDIQDKFFDRRGQPVAPSYDWYDDGHGGQVAVANDFESLAMMTVFHHFEKVWKFAHEVSGDDSEATGEKTLIGFYATVGSNIGGVSIPQITSDNAAFVPMTDSFVILRNQLLDGVPLALNSAVIAHEFSHRMFFHNVYAGAAFDNWYQENIAASSTTADKLRSGILLKALDEGSADTHALSFLGRTDFISDSLQGSLGADTSYQRDVEGKFADEATYEGLQWNDYTSEDTGNSLCNGASDDFSKTDWNFYCLGTVWLRSLWDASGRDVEVMRQEIEPALVRSMKRLGDEYLSSFWGFDFDIILELMAEEVPEGRRSALCDSFDNKFANLMSSGVPACH